MTELLQLRSELSHLRDSLHDLYESDTDTDMSIQLKVSELGETDRLLVEILILMNSKAKSDKQLTAKRIVNQINVMLDSSILMAGKIIEIDEKVRKKGIFTIKNILIFCGVGFAGIISIWSMYIIDPKASESTFGNIIDFFKISKGVKIKYD